MVLVGAWVGIDAIVICTAIRISVRICIGIRIRIGVGVCIGIADDFVAIGNIANASSHAKETG